MKKINKKHDNKDRIICASETGKHKFYYQPVGTKEHLWLFDTKNFSGFVFAFFRKHGRYFEGIGFCMTIKELYEIGNNHNAKITKILERIPVQVEDVIREHSENERIHNQPIVTHLPEPLYFGRDDDERAA